MLRHSAVIAVPCIATNHGDNACLGEFCHLHDACSGTVQGLVFSAFCSQGLQSSFNDVDEHDEDVGGRHILLSSHANPALKISSKAVHETLWRMTALLFVTCTPMLENVFALCSH